MTNYISDSNQEILWKAFQTIPNIHLFSMEQKQELFRGALFEIYETIKGRILTKQELVIWNKKTLHSIIEKIRIQTQTQTQTPPTPTSMYHTPVEKYNISTPPNPIPYFETAEERMKRIFEEKQKQYDQMTSKPDVPKPSELFQEPKEDQDGAIENMDELIKQYQEQRERDISIIPPPIHTTESQYQMNHTNNEPNSSTVDKCMEYIVRLEKRVALLENQMNTIYSR